VVIASSSSSAARHRFFEEAPETISVPLAELLAKLPVQVRKEHQIQAENGRVIALPCRDLLGGNTPRLTLGQLSDLMPELVTVPEGRDRSERLDLPAGWVALHYRLVTRFEEVLTDKGVRPAPVQISPAESAPQPEQELKKPAQVIVIEAEVIPDSPAIVPVLQQKQEADSVPSVDLKPEPLAAPHPKRGFFASLPIFRRNVAAKSSPEEKRLVISEAPAASGMTELPKALALEPLWKLDPLDQLADPAALQALFMTEEKLTLDRVIAMAGQLPGLRACVLAHGEQVICASNTPPGVDLKTLSGQAMTLLSQIKDSTATMGVGSVPGVTLHAEQGALSFLHNGELCLLVLHADRGFLPGVRERLQEMLGHLSHAKALPGGPNAQPSLPI
jgi:predicted regulator of Ras-like GTPase activity (Roadblock/LC7/MglB family)